MRLLSLFAALSGAFALIMLTIAAHAVPGYISHKVDNLHTAGFIQLAAAAAGLAIANRTGRINLIAGAMILAGAAIFSGALYTISLTQAANVVALAPVGGVTLILGWIMLAFAKPTPR